VSTPEKSIAASLATGLDRIHDSWSWFVVCGVALIILGVVCIIGDMTATYATVVALGWLLVVGAVVALAQSFQTYNWSGFLLYFLTALLRAFVGYVLIRYPLKGEVSLTAVVAALFIVGGAFRAIGAGILRFPSWGWMVLSGIIAFILGVWVLTDLQTASLFFLGIVIGVDFVFDGAALIALGTALRRFPAEGDTGKASTA